MTDPSACSETGSGTIPGTDDGVLIEEWLERRAAMMSARQSGGGGSRLVSLSRSFVAKAREVGLLGAVRMSIDFVVQGAVVRR
ncbi:MAG: hypothetical protein QM675_01920 [Protaetiibacter sp.]